VIETVRGLLTGAPIGTSGPLAVLWSAGLLFVSVALAVALFRRRTTR
jgi:ABC-2 type transport system permease protein